MRILRSYTYYWIILENILHNYNHGEMVPNRPKKIRNFAMRDVTTLATFHGTPIWLSVHESRPYLTVDGQARVRLGTAGWVRWMEGSPFFWKSGSGQNLNKKNPHEYTLAKNVAPHKQEDNYNTAHKKRITFRQAQILLVGFQLIGWNPGVEFTSFESSSTFYSIILCALVSRKFGEIFMVAPSSQFETHLERTERPVRLRSKMLSNANNNPVVGLLCRPLFFGMGTCPPATT